MLSYGSSTTSLGAGLGRFIPSLLFGDSVAIKASLGDMCDQQGQAMAMAVFTLGFGIGAVLGISALTQTCIFCKTLLCYRGPAVVMTRPCFPSVVP